VNKNPLESPQPQLALGKAIRELREKRGKTQKDLATGAGITFNTLSLIELGNANPTWRTVRGIASALDVRVSTLARRAEEIEG
jgi:transcriptional regulator with XRE-family HTH domain